MTYADRQILRDLAKRYADICADPRQQLRRDLWRNHNSLERTPPLIYVRAFAWREMPESRCDCEDPGLRTYENFFRYQLFWHSLDDDSIFEPWLLAPAVHACTGWGVASGRVNPEQEGGAYKGIYALQNLSDIERLRPPWHEIDQRQTASRKAVIEDAVGDIIPVYVDRGPAYRMWTGDISTDLGYLRGIENVMADMVENPEWLHRLAQFMSDGIFRAQQQAEEAGDWSLADHQNQAMPYARDLPDPDAGVYGVKRRQLWGYMAAQEFTGVSPAMHEEFLLRYQLPILKEYGLTAYGCCEDLTHKIHMLRQIPNLRRIAVAPAANVAACAEQIGTEYVLSYRPSPADMVGYGFDEARVRDILRKDLQAARHCHVDITLKDVETVQGDLHRVRRWVQIAREEIDWL